MESLAGASSTRGSSSIGSSSAVSWESSGSAGSLPEASMAGSSPGLPVDHVQLGWDRVRLPTSLNLFLKEHDAINSALVPSLESRVSLLDEAEGMGMSAARIKA